MERALPRAALAGIATAVMAAACGHPTESGPARGVGERISPAADAAPPAALDARARPVAAASCIPGDTALDVDDVVVKDAALTICIAPDTDAPRPRAPRTCFGLDLGTGHATPVAVTPAPPPGRPARVDGSWTTRDETGVHVCFPDRDGCRTLVPEGLELGPPGASYVGGNRDGTRFVTCESGGCPTLDVRESERGKVVRRIGAWRTMMGNPAFFRMGFFAGEHIVALVADTPVSSEARIVDANGAVTTKIGRVAEHAPHPLGGHLFAFEAFEAESIITADVRRGKVVATYSLGEIVPADTHAGWPLVAAVTPRSGGGLVVVFTHELVGRVALLGPKTTEPPVLHTIPRCSSTASRPPP